jgi:hypothetical protein
LLKQAGWGWTHCPLLLLLLLLLLRLHQRAGMAGRRWAQEGWLCRSRR